MTIAAAVGGWCVAAALAFELRRRGSLLRDAVHELRGPLTAISLGLDALRRHPAARRRAEALATELSRMEIAIDDAAAAGHGRRAPARTVALDLRPLLERSGEAWRASAERRGGRVIFDWQVCAASVRADPRRLAQAFGNLLANAVEHGGGEIVVRGRPAKGGVRVEIEDRGSGERKGSRRRGRGRGLGIAARALDEAGGRVIALDRSGGGRAAVAELPLDRSR